MFIDVGYLNTYGMTAHELAMKMIKDVLSETGITATAGIGKLVSCEDCNGYCSKSTLSQTRTVCGLLS